LENAAGKGHVTPRKRKRPRDGGLWLIFGMGGVRLAE
jgi:hypothetical protein